MSRYYESYRILLEYLEDDRIKHDDLHALVKRKQTEVIALLREYPKALGSRTAAPFTVEPEHGPTLDAEETEFLKRVARELAVSETTARVLYKKYVNELKLVDVEHLNDALVRSLLEFYFDERKSVFSYLSKLCQLVDSEEHRFTDLAAETMQDLLRDHLEQLLVQALEAPIHGSPVPNDTPESNMYWTNQLLNEKEGILEVLFYLNYTTNPFSADSLLQLATLFAGDKFLFGEAIANLSFVDEVGARTVRRISFMCSLLLVEMMSLERLLPSALDGDDVPMTNSPSGYRGTLAATAELHAVQEHPLLVDEQALQKLKAVFMGLLDARVDPPGGLTRRVPAIAFCAVLARAFSVGMHVAVPKSTPPLRLLRELLDFGHANVEIEGYKSVFLGMFNLYVTVFDVGALRDEQLAEVVRVLSRICAGEPTLCDQFLSDSDTSMQFLGLLERRFPLSMADLATMFRAFCANEQCSRRVYALMCSFRHFVAPIHEVESGLFAYPPLDSVRYEATTASAEVPYSGWVLCFGALLDFAMREGSIARAAAVAGLLDAMLEQMPGLAIELLQHVALVLDEHPNAFSAFIQLQHGRVSDDFLVQLLFRVLERAASSQQLGQRDDLRTELVCSCVNTLSHMMATPFAPLIASTLHEMAVFVSPSVRSMPMMRRLLQQIECATGRYDMTMSFLGLLESLLRWEKQVHITSTEGAAIAASMDLRSYIARMRADVLASYDTWTYRVPKQRWQIGLRSLSVVRLVLLDSRLHSPGSLSHHLMTAILNEGSLQHALFTIIGLGPKTVRNSFAEDSGADLERLVTLAFLILEQVLFWRESQVRLGMTAMTPLESELFSRHGRKGYSLISIIASFVSYRFPTDSELPALPLVAVRVLAQVCRVGHRAPHRPLSIVTFFGDRATLLRNKLLDRLNSQRTPAEMRAAIFNLASVSFATQPGLASLLLNVKLPPRFDAATSSFSIKDDSVLFEALNVLRAARMFMERRPRLVASAMRLFVSLWQVAATHKSVVLLLRQQAGLWDGVGTLVRLGIEELAFSDDETALRGERMFDIETSIDPSAREKRGLLFSETFMSDLSHRHAARTWAVRLMTLEVFISRGKPAPALRRLLRDAISVDGMKSALPSRAGAALADPPQSVENRRNDYHLWLERFCHVSFDRDPLRELSEVAERMSIDLSVFGPHSTPEYGAGYVYDLDLLHATLYGYPSGVLEHVLRLVRRANIVLSHIDAQLALLEATRQFLTVAALRNCLCHNGKLDTMLWSLMDTLARQMRARIELSLGGRSHTQPDAGDESVGFVALLERAQQAALLVMLFRRFQQCSPAHEGLAPILASLLYDTSRLLSRVFIVRRQHTGAFHTSSESLATLFSRSAMLASTARTEADNAARWTSFSARNVRLVSFAASAASGGRERAGDAGAFATFAALGVDERDEGDVAMSREESAPDAAAATVAAAGRGVATNATGANAAADPGSGLHIDLLTMVMLVARFLRKCRVTLKDDDAFSTSFDDSILATLRYVSYALEQDLEHSSRERLDRSGPDTTDRECFAVYVALVDAVLSHRRAVDQCVRVLDHANFFSSLVSFLPTSLLRLDALAEASGATASGASGLLGAAAAPLPETTGSDLFDPATEELLLVRASLACVQNLSSAAPAAERMIRAGLLSALCSADLVTGLQPYTEQQERSQANKAWCMVLCIVGSLVRTLGQSEAIMTSVFEFVAVHHRRILSAIDYPHRYDSISLKRLKETIATMRFLLTLSSRWGLFRISMPPLAAALFGQMLCVYQQLASLLLPSEQFSLYIRLVSANETRKYTMMRPIAERPRSPSPTPMAQQARSPSPVPFSAQPVGASPPPSPVPAQEGYAQPAASTGPEQLDVKVSELMLVVIKYVSAILRHELPSFESARGLEGTDLLSALFFGLKLSEPSPQDAPCLGTLLMCMRNCARLMSTAVDEELALLDERPSYESAASAVALGNVSSTRGSSKQASAEVRALFPDDGASSANPFGPAPKASERRAHFSAAAGPLVAVSSGAAGSGADGASSRLSSASSLPQLTRQSTVRRLHDTPGSVLLQVAREGASPERARHRLQSFVFLNALHMLMAHVALMSDRGVVVARDLVVPLQARLQALRDSNTVKGLRSLHEPLDAALGYLAPIVARTQQQLA